MANVLVVDDDEFLAELVETCLSTMDHTVTLVGNGKDALEKMQAGGYDLIFLDWQLPDMQGLDILSKYRAMSGTAKVVMLTGMRDKRDEVMQAGADDFLPKPFKANDLMSMMAKVCP